jgi:hypothetical protein
VQVNGAGNAQIMGAVVGVQIKATSGPAVQSIRGSEWIVPDQLADLILED